MAQHADHESRIGCSIDAQRPQQVIIRFDTEAGPLRQGNISVNWLVTATERIVREVAIQQRGMNVTPPIPSLRFRLALLASTDSRP
jgi:hypothetical protein